MNKPVVLFCARDNLNFVRKASDLCPRCGRLAVVASPKMVPATPPPIAQPVPTLEQAVANAVQQFEAEHPDQPVA